MRARRPASMSSSRSRKAPRSGLIAAFADACRERRRRADVDMEPRAPLHQTMTVAAFGGALPEARPGVGKECRMVLTKAFQRATSMRDVADWLPSGSIRSDDGMRRGAA